DGRLVAVKVRYPEIDQALAADLRPAAAGARIASIVYPGAAIEPMISELRARFLEECDYLHEARMQTRFRELFREHPTIVVPEVHPRFSTGRVLTMEWIEGRDLQSFLATHPSQSARDRVGEALLEFYI